MKVRELMSYPVPTVKPDAPVRDAIVELFVEEKGTVIITREGLLKKCEGMVTKREVYKKIFAANLDPSSVRVSEVFTPRPLVTVSPNATCREAAELMMKNKFTGCPSSKRTFSSG